MKDNGYKELENWGGGLRDSIAGKSLGFCATDTCLIPEYFALSTDRNDSKVQNQD